MRASPAAQAIGGDLWAEIRSEAARRLLIAGLEAFSEQGYRGTTTRDIAQRAGLSPAALYVHYTSKADLLGAIQVRAHEALLATIVAAAAEHERPAERLAALVRSFVGWQAAHYVLARVSVDDLKEMHTEEGERVAALRRAVAERFDAEIARGIAEDGFDVRDAQATRRAIVSLAMDLCRWYQPDRDGTPEQLGELYAELALRMVGARP